MLNSSNPIYCSCKHSVGLAVQGTNQHASCSAIFSAEKLFEAQPHGETHEEIIPHSLHFDLEVRPATSSHSLLNRISHKVPGKKKKRGL